MGQKLEKHLKKLTSIPDQQSKLGTKKKRYLESEGEQCDNDHINHQGLTGTSTIFQTHLQMWKVTFTFHLHTTLKKLAAVLSFSHCHLLLELGFRCATADAQSQESGLHSLKYQDSSIKNIRTPQSKISGPYNLKY